MGRRVGSEESVVSEESLKETFALKALCRQRSWPHDYLEEVHSRDVLMQRQLKKSLSWSKLNRKTVTGIVLEEEAGQIIFVLYRSI